MSSVQTRMNLCCSPMRQVPKSYALAIFYIGKSDCLAYIAYWPMENKKQLVPERVFRILAFSDKRLSKYWDAVHCVFACVVLYSIYYYITKPV